MGLSSTRSFLNSTLGKRVRYFCFKLDILCELESPAHSHNRAWFLFLAFGYRSSSISIYRALAQIELESDVIELGEFFRGGVGGNTIQVHFPSELVKSLFSFTPSRTSETTVESQLSLPIFAHILSCHLT